MHLIRSGIIFQKNIVFFFEKLDNKIFNTQKIEEEKMPIFEEVSKSRKEIFSHYIDTGKYEIKESDKMKFDFTM